MSWVYNFFFFLFALVAFPKFLIRLKQAEKPARMFRERMGELDEVWKENIQAKPTIWVHAVSVGEVMAVKSWLHVFVRSFPDWQVALSVTTPTGFSVAETLISEQVHVFYFPFDFHFAVKRALETICPKLIVLVETEIWPNFIREASAKSIPIGIINGRISPRAFRRYRWIRFWTRNLLKKLSFCLAQTKRDNDFFEFLGMPASHLFTTGNMKFDSVQNKEESAFPERIRSLFAPLNQSLFVAGSTHEGEEEAVLNVFGKLKALSPRLKLVLAPRHPERLENVLKLIRDKGLSCNLFSSAREISGDVAVIDQMGVLSYVYAYARLVFVGGSLISHGGQNPIEAAQFQKPILHGPNIFNFEEVYRLLDEEQGGFCVQNEFDLLERSKQLISDERLQNQMGANAFRVVQSLRGASKRNLDFLADHFLKQDTCITTKP